jgi:hypothetical protein
MLQQMHVQCSPNIGKRLCGKLPHITSHGNHQSQLEMCTRPRRDCHRRVIHSGSGVAQHRGAVRGSGRVPDTIDSAEFRVPNGQPVCSGQAIAWYSGKRLLSPPVHTALCLRWRHCNCSGRSPVVSGSMRALLHMLPRVLQVRHQPCTVCECLKACRPQPRFAAFDSCMRRVACELHLAQVA